MNARRFVFPAFAALFLICASTSRAWGPVGHKSVAMIAQSRLSPRALQAVAAILGPGVSLEKIANCPDQFVYEPDRSCAGVFTMQGDPRATKSWHFIDLPAAASVDAASLMNYCPRGADCVVAQIRKDIAILQDSRAALIDKQMALMFLVHFVGDVHQPLHAATDGDYGGNLKIMHQITYLGKPLNLHSVWDGEIDDPAKVDYRLPDGVLTSRAEALSSSLESGLRDALTWTAPDDLAAAAALESHDIARTVIYPAYKASRGNDLLADYQAKMRPIAYQRIQMAGVRLAALLEQALTPAPLQADAAAAAAKVLSMLEANKGAMDAL